MKLKIKQLFMKNKKDYENYHVLGEKTVKVKKITPEVYQEAINVLEILPGHMINTWLKFAISNNYNGFFEHILVTSTLIMDELIHLTSILSGLDQNYIKKEVAVAEILEFLFKVLKKNDLDEAIKNMFSPLLQRVMKTLNTEEK